MGGTGSPFIDDLTRLDEAVEDAAPEEGPEVIGRPEQDQAKEQEE